MDFGVMRQTSRRIAVFSTVFVLIGATLFASIVYFGYVAYRTFSIYSHIKSNLYGGWNGAIHRTDDELGYAPIPNSLGDQLLPRGAAIPVRYDQDGFRVPKDYRQPSSGRRPVLLALGCSFTYGKSIPAEDAFAFKVGEELGATVRNAGVFGYGLAHMLIQAKKIAPEIKPDYLIVQYSPWLVERSVSPFAPTAFGKIPVPYFFEQGTLMIQPPLFEAKIIQLPIEKYRNKKTGFFDFLSFLTHVGIPLFVHDDVNIGHYAIRRMISRTPDPAEDHLAIVSHVYGEFSRIALANHSQLVIVALTRPDKTDELPVDLFPKNAIVVNGYAALLRKLDTVNEETYRRTYNHWAGDPPVLVDVHPNTHAHQIIADEIIYNLRSNNKKPGKHG